MECPCMVVDGLKCNNTLTKLNVGKCGLSAKGTVVYKTELKQFGHSSKDTFGQTRFD